MVYRWLADLVVILHLTFIIFVVAGGLLALRWRRAPWLHLPAVAWGAVIEITGAICPLTPLENWLRHTGGGATYERDFIAQYLVPIIYPDRLTREVQWLLGCLLVIINVGIYAVVWRRRKKAGPPDGRRRGRPLLAADSEPRDARQSEPAPKGDHISSASAEGLPNRDTAWPGRRRAIPLRHEMWAHEGDGFERGLRGGRPRGAVRTGDSGVLIQPRRPPSTASTSP